MPASMVLLELAGAVALLLWSTRMVRTGVERAFGARLRRPLGIAFRNRISSACAGMVMALLLQSSTAVVLITMGFVSSGLISAVPAVAAAVGADLGSALLAALLRLDLSILLPIFLLGGFAVFHGTQARIWRQSGRVIFGLGLLLLSLRLISEAAAPLRDSPGLPMILAVIGDDPAMIFLMATVLTWLFHSSLAAILLAALMAGQGLLASNLILPVVFGINLGGAVIAVSLARGVEGEGRIVPLANLALRGTGAVLALVAVMLLSPTPPPTMNPGDLAVAAHVAFNAAVLVVGLLLAAPLCAALRRLLFRRQAQMPRLSALAEADLILPDLALKNAEREIMAVTGLIETMIARLPDLMRHGDDDDFSAFDEVDRAVDRHYAEVKSYLMRIGAETRPVSAAPEVARLMRVVVRLEQVGDVLAQRVAVRARKKRDRQIDFSAEGWAELMALHGELLVSLRLAAGVIASNDTGLAKRLAEQKGIVRAIERNSTARHIERLREGRTDSRDSSALHLDTLYDLKEINSLLVEIGYPWLEEEGLLRDTRLEQQSDV